MLYLETPLSIAKITRDLGFEQTALTVLDVRLHQDRREDAGIQRDYLADLQLTGVVEALDGSNQRKK